MYVYTSGDIGITVWFRPWGTQTHLDTDSSRKGGVSTLHGFQMDTFRNHIYRLDGNLQGEYLTQNQIR